VPKAAGDESGRCRKFQTRLTPWSKESNWFVSTYALLY